MNSKPRRVEVRDGKVQDTPPVNVLEITHRFCRKFMNAGGTWDDLKSLTDSPDSRPFELLLASRHGILPSVLLDEFKDEVELVNLNCAHGLEADVREGSAVMIKDDRLGIWRCEYDSQDSRIVLGDCKLVVMKVEGYCLNQSGLFQLWPLKLVPPADLKLSDKAQVVQLNGQAARWLYAGNFQRLENLFTGLPFEGNEWKNEYIYFLGTVWNETPGDGRKERFDPEISNFMAYAFRSHEVAANNDLITLERVYVPVGVWPADSYVAVLVRQ
jgi:hypothetical protein